MTERLDGTGLHEDAPGIAASSYAADDGLLAELRASWPPAAELPDPERGCVATDLPEVARYTEVLVPELLAATWWRQQG